VVHQDLVQHSGESWGAAAVEHAAVSGMTLEELLLAFQGRSHARLRRYVTLATVDDANVAPAKRDDAILEDTQMAKLYVKHLHESRIAIMTCLEHLGRVGTRVHQIKLGKHSNGALPLRLGRTREGCKKDRVGRRRKRVRKALRQANSAYLGISCFGQLESIAAADEMKGQGRRTGELQTSAKCRSTHSKNGLAINSSTCWRGLSSRQSPQE